MEPLKLGQCLVVCEAEPESLEKYYLITDPVFDSAMEAYSWARTQKSLRRPFVVRVEVDVKVIDTANREALNRKPK
jgi:hypothetical protein